MADCSDTIRELETFLDGELPDEIRVHIDAHLGGCTDCLQAFDFQAELRAAIRRKCSSDEMPPSLLDKIQACFDADFDPDFGPGA